MQNVLVRHGWVLDEKLIVPRTRLDRVLEPLKQAASTPVAPEQERKLVKTYYGEASAYDPCATFVRHEFVRDFCCMSGIVVPADWKAFAKAVLQAIPQLRHVASIPPPEPEIAEPAEPDPLVQVDGPGDGQELRIAQQKIVELPAELKRVRSSRDFFQKDRLNSDRRNGTSLGNTSPSNLSDGKPVDTSTREAV